MKLLGTLALIFSILIEMTIINVVEIGYLYWQILSFITGFDIRAYSLFPYH
jgi:hypothetical protein